MNTLFDGAMYSLILDCLFKGALVMAAAIAISSWMKNRASAAGHHLLWLAAFGTLLLLPLVAWKLPQWNVLPSWMALESGAEGTVAAAATPPPSTPDSGSSESAGSPTAPGPQSSPSTVSSPLKSTSPGSLAPSPEEHSRFVSSNTATNGEAAWRAMDIAFLVWAVVSVLLLLRLLLSCVLLAMLGRRSEIVVTGPLAEAVRRAAAELGICRRITLLVSPRRAMPMTWGILRPKLFLPAEAGTWDSDKLNAVLVHELAHITRRDCLGQLIAQVACAIHWINPLVWLAARKMHGQCERACDDLVLDSGMKASAYAEHLLEVAGGLEMPRPAGAAAVAMAQRHAVEGRLCDVLDSGKSRRALTRRVCLSGLLAALTAAVLLGVVQARQGDDKSAAGKTEESSGAVGGSDEEEKSSGAGGGDEEVAFVARILDDRSGKPVPGAQVQVGARALPGKVHTLQTDHEGEVAIPVLKWTPRDADDLGNLRVTVDGTVVADVYIGAEQFSGKLRKESTPFLIEVDDPFQGNQMLTFVLDVNDHQEGLAETKPLTIQFSGTWRGKKPWSTEFRQEGKKSRWVAEVPRAIEDPKITMKGRENTLFGSKYPGSEMRLPTNPFALDNVTEASGRTHVWAMDGSRIKVTIVPPEGQPAPEVKLGAEYRGASGGTQPLALEKLENGKYQSARVRENDTITLLMSAKGFHDTVLELPAMKRAEDREVRLELVPVSEPRPVPAHEIARREWSKEWKEVHPGFVLDKAQEAKLSWGPRGKDGVQAAMAFEPAAKSYRLGQQVKRKLYIKNSGKKALQFSVQAFMESFQGRHFDQHGFEIEQSHLLYSGIRQHRRIKLEPGQVFEVETPDLHIGWHAQSDHIAVRPGQKCRIQFGVSLPGMMSWDGHGFLVVPSRDDWVGDLLTGVTRFEVTDEKGVFPGRIIPPWIKNEKEGLEARLWLDAVRWPAGSVPTVTAEIRNTGEGKFLVARTEQTCGISVDGTWYVCKEINAKSSPLEKGTHYKDIKFQLDDKWISFEGSKPLPKLEPGKHRVRIGFRPKDSANLERDIWVMSNTVNFVVER